jgi:hypothetical protein
MQAASQASQNATESNASTIITTVAAIIGAVLGTTGFFLSLLNHRRDNPKVVPSFKGALTGGSRYPGEWVQVRVANVGQRPVHILHVGFKMPLWPRFHHTVNGKKKRISYLILDGDRLVPASVPFGLPVDHMILGGEGVKSWRLDEGDRPTEFTISQKKFAEYRTAWSHMKVFACDSGGTMHIGGKPLGQRPNWSDL